MYRLLILFFSLFINAEEVKTQKIAEITVEDLTNIVRLIVQETLANCMVTGEMKGRAKFNLDVEGEVIARLECEFEEAAIAEEQTED